MHEAQAELQRHLALAEAERGEVEVVVPRTPGDKSPSVIPSLRSQPVAFEAAVPQRLNLDHIINPHAEENKRISQEVLDMRDRLKAFNSELRALEEERRLLLQGGQAGSQAPLQRMPGVEPHPPEGARRGASTSALRSADQPSHEGHFASRKPLRR